MRKMGLLAMSRCSRPAGFVRLTAICVTSAVRPRAVRAAMAAPSVSSAMAEMQMRAFGFLPSTSSSTASMPPLVPPMNTASGAGRSASTSGARPSMRMRLQAWNFARFYGSVHRHPVHTPRRKRGLWVPPAQAPRSHCRCLRPHPTECRWALPPALPAQQRAPPAWSWAPRSG